MDALRTGLSFLAGYEDPALLHDNSHEANLEKGIRLLAKTPTIAVNSYRALNGQPVVRPNPDLPYMENFLYMLRGERPDAESLDAFDRIHICYIEHEMPNSTFRGARDSVHAVGYVRRDGGRGGVAQRATARRRE